MAASLASADAVLSETERELGVAVADFGAGTIDLALLMDGSPFHAAVLPLGGNNVTNDVAIGLKTSLAAAEQLKIEHGTRRPATRSTPRTRSSVEEIGEDDGRTASQAGAGEIIEARMREVFEKIGEEMQNGRRGRHAAGRPGHDRRRCAAGRHGRARPGSAGDAGARRRPDGRRAA